MRGDEQPSGPHALRSGSVAFRAVSEIRVATTVDTEQLVALGRRFLASSGYGVKVPDDEAREGIEMLIHSGRVFVAEKDKKIVGALGARMTNLWFSQSLTVASELMWWVDEEHRGTLAAVRLVGAFEAWAKAEGAHFIAMSDITGLGNVDKLLKRLGYKCVERAHVKGVA